MVGDEAQPPRNGHQVDTGAQLRPLEVQHARELFGPLNPRLARQLLLAYVERFLHAFGQHDAP